MYEPMKLTAPLKDYLWGGTRLRDEYGKRTELSKVAESWELACHRDGKSVIASGAAAGETLEAWLTRGAVSVFPSPHQADRCTRQSLRAGASER